MLIDPKSAKPIFRQISDQIRLQIRSGVYKPGEPLPSQRRLAKEIRVNANTVQKAYDVLMQEGEVESRRGAGVFVIDQPKIKSLEKYEDKLVVGFEKVIARALDKDISPDRIRQLFRHAIGQELARKQASL